jgi:hypothetical protein
MDCPVKTALSGVCLLYVYLNMIKPINNLNSNSTFGWVTRSRPLGGSSGDGQGFWLDLLARMRFKDGSIAGDRTLGRVILPG